MRMPWSTRWPRLLYRCYRPLARTWRMRVLLSDGRCVRPEEIPVQASIYAHSEQDDLVLAALLGLHGFAVLVTEGRDGDRATAVLERFGAAVIRGSSLRAGSQSLMRLIQQLRKSAQPLVISVDGPLGPRGRAKPGALLCAKHTGRPIVPLAASASRALVFRKSWAGMYLPLPFARVALAMGHPMPVPPEIPLAELGSRAEELSQALSEARDRAAQHIHRT